jgi:hypothetical protein
MKVRETITPQEPDEKFDNGEDVCADFDWSKARRPNQEARRVNVDFPAWMVRDLDKEAGRLLGERRLDDALRRSKATVAANPG